MPGVRGKGHVADRHDHVAEDLSTRHVARLIGSAHAGATTDEVDYSSLLDVVPDQGGSESCVGQAFATALFVLAHLNGIPLPRPSSKAIWDLARLTDAPAPLVNIGCRPRAALDAMATDGLVAESRWPLSVDNLNDPPPLDVFRAGLGAKLTAYYRCDGADVASQIRAALVQRFVPVFAMQVDAAYERYDGSAIYPGLTGNILGSHMQAIVGCTDEALIVANSWGEGWGRGGFALIAPTFFNSSAVSDVLVPTVTPREIT